MNNKSKWFRKKFHRIPKNLRAQSVIEFALTLPLILVLVLGMVDFGRIFFTKMILTNAAREGANYLAYFPEDADNGYADTFIAIYNEGYSSNVEIETADVSYANCCTRGMPVEVTITKAVDLIFDAPLQSLGLMGGPFNLSSTVKMMVQ